MTAADQLNLGDLTPAYDSGDPPGYQSAMDRFGSRIGAQQLGASLYELPPSQSICPYHYEYGREEWVIVLDGAPTLRTPRGTETLQSGDTIVFPEGPDGAHKVTNDTSQIVRVLMLSNTTDPSVALYPDSGKIGVWPPGKLFRLSQEVDYWDGEPISETRDSGS
jgi:uncharacterized cupin superfamily protein